MPVVEAIGALVIAVGVIVAFMVWAMSETRMRPVAYEHVRLLLGRYLALGLEFQLAADILKTAVSPSWTDIEQLAAIAGIRTVLNFFLAREIESAAVMEKRGMLAGPGDMPPPMDSHPRPAKR